METKEEKINEFTIDLLHEYQRPIIEIGGIKALIDTGAVIPTFSIPVPAIESLYNAKKILDKANISGFGGNCSGKVYEMSSFSVGKMKFEPFQFFVPDELNIKHPILLSATMFYGSDYDIDTINNKLTVRVNDERDFVKSFKIKDMRGQLYVQINDVLLQDTDLGIKEFDNYFQIANDSISKLRAATKQSTIKLNSHMSLFEDNMRQKTIKSIEQVALVKS